MIVKITGIEVQKKDKERISLFIDGEFWLGISRSLFEELEIQKNQELSQKEREIIERLALEDKAFYWSLNRLSYKMYSVNQLKSKLKEKGYSEETIEKTLKRCRDLSLLDDKLFAETIANERKRKNQGSARVKQYLGQAGIDEAIIKKTIIDSFPMENEEEAVNRALLEKYPESLNPDQARKAYQFLVRRGFSSSTSRTVVDKNRMTEEEIRSLYGREEALSALIKKWPSGKDFSEEKAWRFLAYRGFRSSAIKEAISLYSSSR